MTRGTWKRRERQIAADFGVNRTPLSGGNSRHTRSDSLHDRIFIEVKGRKQHAAVKLFDEVGGMAAAEDKIPVVTLWQPGRPGYLVICRPEDLPAVAAEYRKEER